MITVSQIRAARGLLGWSQRDLADRTGLSQRTITNIETEKNIPNSETLATIERMIQQAGIDITNNGVRLRRKPVQMIQGEDISARLLDDMLKHVCEFGVRDIAMSGINQELLRGEARERIIDYGRKIRLFGARERFLVPETMPQSVMVTTVDCYRGMPWEYFSDKVQTFIYGHNVAILMLSTMDLHIIRHPQVAEAYRKKFEFMWKHAKVFDAEDHHVVNPSEGKRAGLFGG